MASKHLDTAIYCGPGCRHMLSVIAMESTGRYHELLALAAHARGLQVHGMNPRDVRHYARGMGRNP